MLPSFTVITIAVLLRSTNFTFRYAALRLFYRLPCSRDIRTNTWELARQVCKVGFRGRDTECHAGLL